MNFRKISLIALLCFCLLLSACKSKEAKTADTLIKDIGEVTLDSLNKIVEAEEAVDALTQENKDQLDNLKALEDAREKYEFLVLDDAANKIEKSISGIGEITSSKAQLIVDVRGEYNTAQAEVKELVENYDDLLYAENRIKAVSIDEKISEIAEVSFDYSSKFNAALKAYSEATDEVQKLVEYADKLLDYKNKFDALISNEVVFLIDAIGDVTIDDEQVIKNVRSQYDALSEEGKQMVSNYQTLVSAEPALEEAKKKAEEAAVNDALSRINTKTDKVQGITWYQSKRQPYYADTRCYVLPYIGKNDSSTWLRLQYHYTSDSWIFFDSLLIFIDGERTSKSFSYSQVERDNDTEVWEWADIAPTKSDIEMLWKIANSTETIIRFNGDTKFHDFTVPAADKQAIKDILTVYEAWTKK